MGGNTVRGAWMGVETGGNSAKRQGRLAALGASVCVLALMSGGVHAQGTGEAIQLGEVVVDGAKKTGRIPTNGPTGIKGYTAEAASVGTKTNTPLAKVPASISVITRENLSDRNVQDLNSALAYTPGASTNVFGYDPRFEDIYIRGFDSIYNGVYRDGLRDQNAAGAGAVFRNEPYGFDSITVLRGPAAATYGYGSPGGIVDITSKRATFTKFGEVQLQFGNFERKQGNFDFGDVVGGTDGKLAYRMTGIVRDSNTFPSGPDDRISLAPTFTYAPDGATSFTFLSGYDKVKVPGTVAFYNTANFDVTNIMFGDPAFNKLSQEQYRIGYAFEHHVSPDLTIRQNLRYAHLDLSWRYTTVDSINPGGDTANRSKGLLFEDQGTFAVDNQVEKRFDLGPTRHVVLAGLDYTHANFNSRFGTAPAPQLNLITRNYGQQFISDPPLDPSVLNTAQRQDQLGEYLQDQIEWDRAFLTLSGRHDTVNSTTDNRGPGGSVIQQNNDGLTGRVGLNYRILPGVVPYVSYATTFAPNLGVSAAGQPFPVQRGDQKEAGVKTQVPKTDLHLNAAVFEIVESSVIRTAGNLAFSEATGKVRSRGYEIEAVDHIAPGTNLTASFTHIDLTYLDNSPDTNGHRLSGIPGDTATAFINYTVPVAGPLGGLNVGGGIRHYGFSFADDLNTAINRPATVFDAVVGYEFAALSHSLKGLRAQLNGYNVFDRYYTTCQAGFCYRGAPLQVIGSLIYKW